MKVLMFPSTTFEAISVASQLKNEGHYVIGAASIESELVNDNVFDKKIYIPHIVDDDFIEVLETKSKKHAVTHFWTSVNSVYGIAEKLLTDLDIELLSCDPMKSPLIPVELVCSEVNCRKHYLKAIQQTINNEQVSNTNVGSIIFNVLSVPGQSHFDKLITICQIFSDIPSEGDIVEIGSLWGRSATLFSLLSNLFEKGSLLCIDPWPSNGMTQGTGSRLESYSKDLDSSSCFTIFFMKLACLFPGKINYIKDYSDNALPIYKGIQEQLITTEFGAVPYTKMISLLHIDGNHSIESVRSDVENWCPLVVPGGWIIFDDYNWSYGPGPTTVVDDYLSQNIVRIELAFFSGGALFVKLKSRSEDGV